MPSFNVLPSLLGLLNPTRLLVQYTRVRADDAYKIIMPCRVKMLMTTARPHNQRDADAAGGLGPPDNGRKLRSQTAGSMDL
jgi:hypothetical protein